MATRTARVLPGRLVGRLAASAPVRALRSRLPGGTPAERPLLSVVVCVHNDQDRLADCVDSLLQQTLQEIEVLLVDSGSCDHSPDIIAEYAARDPRVRAITLGDVGPGQARNRGVAAATGPFLTFVDADDTIPPAAYDYMVATLTRTGSDFAVGAVRGLKHGQSTRPAWVREVHRVKRLRTTVEDFPDAMHDVIACNRVFRRQFWVDRVGPFPTGPGPEDHALMVAAYVRAGTFDLLSATTSNVRIRDDAASLWQQKHQIKNLEHRVAATERAWEMVRTEASAAVAAAWLGRVLDFDLSLYVEFALHADDSYRELVQATAQRFGERADAAAWRQVHVDRKLRLALAAVGEWAQVERLGEHFRLDGSLPPTRVDEGRILATLPFSDELGVPEARYELSATQTRLAACIRSVGWQPDGRLLVEGWAYISALDLDRVSPTVTAELVSSPGGERVALEVTPYSSPAITRWSGHVHQRYDRAGFGVCVDVDQLVRHDGDGSVRWQLVVGVAAAGLTRQGPVRSVVRSGIALRMQAGDLADADLPYRVVPLMDDRLGFVVQVRRDRLRATALHARGSRQLSGAVAVRRPMEARPQQVLARQNGRTVARSPLVEQPDGTYAFGLTLPVKRRPDHWDVRVLDDAGGLHRLGWPTEHDHGRTVGRYGTGTARWRRSPRGFVQLSSRPVRLQAHRVEVGVDEVVVTVTLDGRRPAALSGALLRSPLLTLEAVAARPRPDGRHDLVFPARAALWGSARVLPLPSGTYTVVLPDPVEDKTLTCGTTTDLMETLPRETLTATHAVTVARHPSSDQLTIELGPPLADDERGAGAQHRLARWYADTDFAPRDEAFFQCYRGEFATDSQRAVHEELWRRGTALDLVWGVHDHSVELPEGGRAVLMGSRAWYETLAAARYLCNNNDFDHFFSRRPHQKFLQTFHGYPFKSMGVSFWRARDVSPELIEYECRRRTDAWTSILIPASFCEEIYRAEYLYEGEMLTTGYPRNDVLARPDPSVRATVLRRLGVDPGKTVVLYGPTWRDTIATGDWSATFFDALDLDRLADSLGSDHVVLLRGHNFNMREGVPKPSHAQVVDVTRYPEITDLIQAADVAVLDYSSLRFDWVLTGKPVLFFVPDLADYLSARTALFEYGPTAPGPLLSTTTEVIDALLDLDSVSRDYAAARIEFNERFNALHDGGATSRVVDAFFGAEAGR